MGRQSARTREWLSVRIVDSLSDGAAEHLSGQEPEQQSNEKFHRQSGQEPDKPGAVGRKVRTIDWQTVKAIERRRDRPSGCWSGSVWLVKRRSS